MWNRAVRQLIACSLVATGATRMDVTPQADLRQQLAAHFQSELATIAAGASGVTGISIVDLETGERFGINDNAVFAQGSAIKVTILIELFRRADAGDLKLTERIPVRASDQVGGSGVLQYFADGDTTISLRDLAIPMIVLSDNTATNMLIERLGMDRVTQTAHALGASHTRLQRKMIQPEESAKGHENISSPREAADIMGRIARCELPVKKESCAELTRILEIPKSGGFRRAIPPGVPVAWKPGTLEGVATAWGLVELPGRPYVIAVMVNYAIGDPEETVARVSEAAYKYFSQLARSTPYGTRVPLQYLKKP